MSEALVQTVLARALPFSMSKLEEVTPMGAIDLMAVLGGVPSGSLSFGSSGAVAAVLVSLLAVAAVGIALALPRRATRARRIDLHAAAAR
jgi:hypothetical protein